jgi:hypothetical protein
MSRALVQSVHTLVNFPFFDPTQVRQADAMNRRKGQLFPLECMHIKQVAATPKHLKSVKKRGYSSEILILPFPFFNLLKLTERDLNLPGEVDLSVVM